MRLLPATDLTIAGIVKHLAWAEDRWFQGRFLGATMPSPWNVPGADDPDRSMRLAAGDTVDWIIGTYSSACERSRTGAAQVSWVPCLRRGRLGAVPHRLGPRGCRRRDTPSGGGVIQGRTLSLTTALLEILAITFLFLALAYVAPALYLNRKGR